MMAKNLLTPARKHRALVEASWQCMCAGLCPGGHGQTRSWDGKTSVPAHCLARHGAPAPRGARIVLRVIEARRLDESAPEDALLVICEPCLIAATSRAPRPGELALDAPGD
jgi:hypothetical protein